jgi:hypothetical protein
LTDLLVDDGSESSLALDDGIWDAHLAAQSGEEDDELDRVNVVGDKDERGLLVLNQGHNVVETVLDNVRLLANILLLLTLLDSSGFLEETLLLLRLGLWPVLVQELECLSSGVLVEDVLELGNRRRDLQSKTEDLLLALKTNILGPFYHTRQVTPWLDVLTDTEVARPLLDQRVLPILMLDIVEARWAARLLTLAAFFPAFAWGKGAGAAFFPDFGGYH